MKVYLYGLMMAHSGAAEGESLLLDLERALEMPEEKVLSAFRYWERSGLTERISDNPPRFRFLSPVQLLMNRSDLPEDREYNRFAQSLNAIFEDTSRKLHGGETVKAFEWVEALGLPGEVVLMLVTYMKRVHGLHFSFDTAEKIALEMKTGKVDSVEKAEAFFEKNEPLFKGAKKVLAKLGRKGRDPSDAELALYQKWVQDWQIDPKAVLESCNATANAGNPTFAYLDKILEGMKGTAGAEEARATLETGKQEREALRELLHRLGQTAEYPNEGMLILYRSLARHGQETALLAAEQVGMSSQDHTLEKVEELLSRWEEKGLTDPAAIRAHLEELKPVNDTITRLMERMGRRGGRTEANRTLVKKWLTLWPGEMLDMAADCAVNAKAPFPYMDKLLTTWAEKGISDPAAAKADHEAFHRTQGTEGNKPAGKRVMEQQYHQRPADFSHVGGLTPEELEEMKKL